ncbi:hypothetical protein IJ732_04395 [bacterium]|nr:hypothetical protein [bacterium]
MKILQILIVFALTQTACLAYNPYVSPIINQRLYRRGVVTGIPAPIFQYNVPNAPETYYINRKHIKKKYRKYYPQSQSGSSFTIIEQY